MAGEISGCQHSPPDGSLEEINSSPPHPPQKNKDMFGDCTDLFDERLLCYRYDAATLITSVPQAKSSNNKYAIILHCALGAEMENASTETFEDPSSAAVISEPPAPPPAPLMDKLKAASP